ncbi:MAG: membrane protein insertase YidC [Armatimonadota bacterium]|nr:membrane protein insertase YidC [Armatimonadota bacterium]
MANTQNVKKQNFLLLALLLVTWIIMFQVWSPGKRQQPAKKPNPEVLLQMGDKQLKSRDYPAAIGSYEKVAREFKGTRYGAIGLLRKAGAMRDATGKAKNEYGAIDAYKKLIAQYEKFGFPEVAQARRDMRSVQIKMDDHNSHSWMYKTLDTLVGFGRALHMGRYSYAFALFLVVIIVKLLTWKLSAVQYKGMRDMQRVQPMVKEIQAKHKGDPKTMNAKVMEAYKREGVNPLMGCLPLLVQLPVMWVIWYAIRGYEYQFQNGIFLWINGAMHVKFPSISIGSFDLPFIGANLAQPDIPLVILYTISMFFTQKLTVVDATQAEQQKIMAIVMPLMLAFFFWSFASAFLLYWFLLNLVMTAHQYYVLKSHAPAPTPAHAPRVVESTVATPTRPARSRRRRKH